MVYIYLIIMCLDDCVSVYMCIYATLKSLSFLRSVHMYQNGNFEGYYFSRIFPAPSTPID